jgi:hypothetical protein
MTETRNQIYELVMRNENDAASFVTYTYKPGRTYSSHTTGNQGLSQVCRQVRLEFLPLFQQRAVYSRVNIQDLGLYLKTFFDLGNIHLYATLYGSIQVDLHSLAGSTQQSVDLLPLFKMLLVAPRLQATFAAAHVVSIDGPPPFLEDMCKLLRIMKRVDDKTMRHHILRLLKSIELSLPVTKEYVPHLVVKQWPGKKIGWADDRRFLEASGMGNMKQLEVTLHRCI